MVASKDANNWMKKNVKVTPQNLIEEFKKIKRDTKDGGESTDDEHITRELDRLYEKNRNEISQRMDDSSML